MSERYEGKPFLRLLDSYVLDAIGHLDMIAAGSLRAVEGELGASHGLSGTWREMVESQMQFPAGMPAAIREVWDKGAVKYRLAHGAEPDPREFTRIFVDTNFPH